VPHHDLLPSEPLVAHPSTLLAVVWHVDVSAVQLRCRLRGDCRNYRIAVVPSAEGFLLCNSGSRLRDYCSAGDHSDGPTHSVSHAATHTSTHATAHATYSGARTDSASSTTHSGTRTC